MSIFSWGLMVVGILFSPVISFSQAPGDSLQEAQAHEQKAHTYLEQKRPDLAIPEFESVVKLEPQNLNAQANLGVLLYFSNDYARAIPHLRDALEMQSNLPKIRGLLGIAEKRSGDATSARKDLEQAFPEITEENFKVQVGLELIEMYTASSDLDKAAVVISQLKQSYPENKEVLYVAYRIFADQAGEAMLTLSLVAPDSAQMHQVMAYEDARRGDNTDAIAQYRQAIAIDPKLPGVHFELAELLNNAQDTKTKEGAKQEYLAALNENSFNEKTLSRLGDIYMREGDIQKASDSYMKALHLQPDDPEANFGLAKALIAMDKKTQALPVLEKAVQLDPTNAAAHFRLSTLYRESGNIPASRHEVDEYKKYNDMKEKLRTIYKEMQVSTNDKRVNEQDDK